MAQPWPLKADIVHFIIAHFQLQRNLVAAQGVEAVGLVGGVVQIAEVAGPAVVFQQNLLIKVAQVGCHQPNTSITRSMALTRASTSSVVL